MLLAVMEFQKHKTTFVPRRESSSFIQSGIFKRSRNPIYLGDAMVLAGAILYMDAVLALPLVPLFIWIIEKRFIEGEENHLRRTYRAQFAGYENKVRRWI
jgi:protein-S-isoprenylcysteine O-methyltransferase Ste14